MGAVFMAEQGACAPQVSSQDHQPGMDGRQVVARFEAERRAAAMMDHQNIEVLDAGTTASGRPSSWSLRPRSPLPQFAR